MDTLALGLSLLGLGVMTAPLLSKRYVAPLDAMIVTSAFGVERERGSHGGVDLRARIGTPVYAPEGGRAVRRDGGERGGKVVKLFGRGGRTHIFAHLSRWNVIDDLVTPGQIIGWTGETGNVSGPHLHWQILGNMKLIDPLKWLEGVS